MNEKDYILKNCLEDFLHNNQEKKEKIKECYSNTMLSKVLKSSNSAASRFLRITNNSKYTSAALKVKGAFGSCNVNALHKFGEEVE